MNEEALIAVKNGNLEKLKLIHDQGLDINVQDDNGETLLHHAARNGQHEIIEFLLHYDADILITDNKNNTALHIAAANNDYDCPFMVKYILEMVTREKLRKLINLKSKANGTTALHIAAKNGEKPVDVANGDDTRELFTVIEESFALAKNGDEMLISQLDKCTNLLQAVFNCRNNEGRTIMQVILMNQHDLLSGDLSQLRSEILMDVPNFEWMFGYDRKNEINKLGEKIEEYQVFYFEHAKANLNFAMHNTRGISKTSRVDDNTFVVNQMKSACQVLEKAHEVYLAYRKFEGKKKSLTTGAAMKTLEEVFELLGFNPEEPFVIIGEESCYYKKLPVEWNDWRFFLLIDFVIHASIFYFSYYLNMVRLVHAVNDDDIDKVEYLLDHNEPIRIIRFIDLNKRTILCYAAEKGNTKIIRLLLKYGAIVVVENAISPVYLAANKGHAKAVKLLLEHVDTKCITKFIDLQRKCKGTALHAAAKKGYLNIVKMLLRYGATYSIVDEKNRTPLDVSTNQEVSDFLIIVDEHFQDAKTNVDGFVFKLKSLKTDDFMAIANTRNSEGHTLAVVAVKVGAKNIAAFIFKMIKETKKKEEQ